MNKDKPNEEHPFDGKDLTLRIINILSEYFWQPLYKFLEKYPEKLKTFTGFLLDNEHIVLYFGKTHLAIEYFGNERLTELPKLTDMKVSYHDLTDLDVNLLDEIIGFSYKSTSMPFTLSLPLFSEDFVLPTNDGMDKLLELNWNWMAQNSIMAINGPGFHVEEGEFARMINARFFDSNDNGLRTRHIKWIDFIPLEINDVTEKTHQLQIKINELIQTTEFTANYIYPLPQKDDFKFNKLPQINRFIELIGDLSTSETDLTTFLEQPENKFIITMGILSTDIYPQRSLEWQSQSKDNLRPDFLIARPNGYADILEFKLPKLKYNSIVGKNNRESFSAEINSYIAQTRVYKEYFEDPNNREWVKTKYDLNVRYPKRFLIVGRRWDFSSEEWREIISEFKDIEIISFDELIDGVVSQFYM